MDNTLLLFIFGCVIFTLAFYISLRNNIFGMRDSFLKRFPSYKATFTRWKWIGPGSSAQGAPKSHEVVMKHENSQNEILLKQVQMTMAAGEVEAAKQMSIDPTYRIDCSHFKSGGVTKSPFGGDVPQTSTQTAENANCNKVKIVIQNKAPSTHVGELAWRAFAHKHGG